MLSLRSRFFIFPLFAFAPYTVLRAALLLSLGVVFCAGAQALPDVEAGSQTKTPAAGTGSGSAPDAAISSSNQINLLPLTNVLPPQFVRIAPYGSAPIDSDYSADIMNATKNRVLRFKNMPVKVYITPFPEPGFTEACIKGFDEWENRTNGLVAFLRVDDPDQARVRVVWKRMGSQGNSKDCMLGAQTITRWQAKRQTPMGVIPVSGIPVPIFIPRIGAQYSVEPQIIEVNLDLVYSRDRDIRLLVLKNVVTHELGHALGLLGHSPMRADLMFAETDETSRLSPRDINTIKKLYQMKVDIPL